MLGGLRLTASNPAPQRYYPHALKPTRHYPHPQPPQQQTIPPSFSPRFFPGQAPIDPRTPSRARMVENFNRSKRVNASGLTCKNRGGWLRCDAFSPVPYGV